MFRGGKVSRRDVIMVGCSPGKINDYKNTTGMKQVQVMGSKYILSAISSP